MFGVGVEGGGVRGWMGGGVDGWGELVDEPVGGVFGH